MRRPGPEGEKTETRKGSDWIEPVEDMLLWRFNLHVRGFVGDEIKRGVDPLQIASLFLALAVELGRQHASRTTGTKPPR
jgi:hypothetical protein